MTKMSKPLICRECGSIEVMIGRVDDPSGVGYWASCKKCGWDSELFLSRIPLMTYLTPEQLIIDLKKLKRQNEQLSIENAELRRKYEWKKILE